MLVYDAFISYSHAKDKPIATVLQTTIQKLGKPWYRRRALRLFRDDTSLSATPHLWPAIQQALEQSRYLILMTSPEAAASPWINKELDFWLDKKSAETLFIGLTDGELRWDSHNQDFNWDSNTPLPSVLKGRLGSEPKWVDLTAYRDAVADSKDAKFTELAANFAAAIRGIPKDDLLSQEVRQQRRALALAWSAAGCLLLLAIAATGASVVAFKEKEEASRQLLASQKEQIRNFVFRARRLIRANEPAAAMEVALSALPQSNPPGWPLMASAQRILYDAFEANHQQAILQGGNDAAFSPDGKTVATGSDDGIVRISDATNGKTLTELFWGAKTHLTGLQFSPDGQLLLTSSRDSQARIFSVLSGKSIGTLAGVKGSAKAIYSAGGKRILTVSSEDRPRLWSSDGQQQVAVLGDAVAQAGDFSPDGERIAILSGGTVTIWSARGGERISELAGFHGRPSRGSFSPDGKRIVGLGKDNNAGIWSTDSGQPLLTLHGHQGPVLCAAYSPLGDVVVTGSADYTARIWSAATGKEKQSFSGHLEAPREVSFSPDGRWITTISGSDTENASKEQAVRLWSSGDAGRLYALLRHDDYGYIQSASFSPDGRKIVTTAGGRAFVWSVDPGGALRTFDSFEDHAELSADGRYVATETIAHKNAGKNRDRIQVATVATGEKRDLKEGDGDFGFFAWTFSPDDKLAAIAYGSTAYVVTTGENTTLTAKLERHTNIIRGIRFSSDGTRIVTFADDKTMRLWSQDGTQIIAFANSSNPDDGSDNQIISPGRKWLVTVADDGIARVWSADDGAPISTVPGKKIATAALSADSECLLTISQDNEVIVWNPKTGKRLVRLASDANDGITQATFSADAKRIITVGSSSPDNVSIWDVSTGKRIMRLKNEDGLLARRAMFAPDERYIYGWEAGSEARPSTARVWSAQTGEILASVGNGENVDSVRTSGDSKVLLTAELGKIARARIFPDPGRIATLATELVRRLTPLEQPRACNEIVGVCEER